MALCQQAVGMLEVLSSTDLTRQDADKRVTSGKLCGKGRCVFSRSDHVNLDKIVEFERAAVSRIHSAPKENMSKSAFSAKVFAVYLFVVGAMLVVAPNVLLSIFGIAPSTEVWIRVVGVTAFMIGVYAWVAAKHENRPFLEASVYTRCVVFVAFTTFAVIGLSSPMIVLFGVVDLCGGLWTYFALKADAQSAKSTLAGLSEA